jgi:DNA/RNA-binding domain of Phe-tRNA-synthetase-like protein
MTEISMESKLSGAFPDAQIRFVAAYGLHNTDDWPEVISAIEALERRVSRGDWVPAGKEDPSIASWHDAYRSFGTNPNRCRPSVDALSRRLAKNHVLPRINPAVNLYNYISVKHAVPAGAFDLDKISGPVTIRFAQEGDRFVPLGEPDTEETPNQGEVVYADGSRILTRHWNYRDSDFTKVTERTTNAVFIFERISARAVGWEQLREAQMEFLERLRPHADRVVAAVIEAETPVTELREGEPGFAV